MSKLRRYYREGNLYFLTNVTIDRRMILIDNVDLMTAAFQKGKELWKIDIIAWVILPEHFHIVIDTRTDNPANIMRRIKLSFSMNLRKRMRIASGRVWQYRFWDHVIRDQDDLNKHIDYIHYNPVKHGLVVSPFAWKFSSIHEFYAQGFYASDWGVRDSPKFEGEFGE